MGSSLKMSMASLIPLSPKVEFILLPLSMNYVLSDSLLTNIKCGRSDGVRLLRVSHKRYCIFQLILSWITLPLPSLLSNNQF